MSPKCQGSRDSPGLGGGGGGGSSSRGWLLAERFAGWGKLLMWGGVGEGGWIWRGRESGIVGVTVVDTVYREVFVATAGCKGVQAPRERGRQVADAYRRLHVVVAREVAGKRVFVVVFVLFSRVKALASGKSCLVRVEGEIQVFAPVVTGEEKCMRKEGPMTRGCQALQTAVQGFCPLFIRTR